MKRLRSLADVVRSHDAVVFLGAGASWDSGLPLGDAAAAGIIRACFEVAGFGKVMARIDRATAHSVQSIWPRVEVVLDVLDKYLPGSSSEVIETFSSVGVSSTQQVLAGCCLESWLWLTTNFDDQIERALDSLGKTYRSIVSRRAMMKISSPTRNQIVKLHGDASASAKDLGATMDQILRTFPDSARRALVDVAKGRPVIFIGYAARDPDLLPLVKDIFINASLVTWILKGATPRGVSELAKLQPRFQAFSQGVPDVFELEMGILPPKPILAGSWKEKVRHWALSQVANESTRVRLAHALASLCVSRGVPVCRDAAKKILDAIPERGEQDRRWRFETEFKRLEQLPTYGEPQMRRLIRDWRTLIHNRRSRLEKTAICESYTLLANYSRKHGDYEGARVSADLAVGMHSDVPEARARINALRALGMAQVYCGASWLKEGQRNLRKAKEIAHAAGEIQLEAQAKEELAVGYIRGNQREKAAQLLTEADAVFGEVGDPRLLVSCHRNLAETIRMAGKVTEALKLNQEVLESARLLEDYEAKRKTINNLAICLAQEGSPSEADRAWMETIAEARRKGRLEYCVDPMHNRGWLRVMLGEWSAASRLLTPVVRLQLKRGSKERAGGTLCLIGWCAIHLGDTSSAAKLLRRVEQEGLVPAGPPRGFLIILRLALRGPGRDIAAFVKHAEQQLAGHDEQKFLLFSWLLESERKSIDPKTAAVLVHLCLAAIVESRQFLLASVLDDILTTLKIPVTATTTRAIKRLKKGEIRDLRKQLVR
jgi:tetratricopeptide (TPR) repeat protein